MIPSKEETHFRGMFISLFIDIEFLISDTISTILVDDNIFKLNLMEYVMPNLLLNNKITLLNKILFKKFRKLYINYENNLKDLKKLGKLRNNFAHKRIEIDKSQNILYFIIIDNFILNKQPHTFNELNTKFEELKVILKRINELHKKIVNDF